MRAGALNRRVRIDYRGPSQDDLGQPVESQWQPLVIVWANILMSTGKRVASSDTNVGTATASIRVRFRTDVEVGMRAVSLIYVNGQPVDQQIFDILQPLPDFAARDYTDLVCSTVTTNV